MLHGHRQWVEAVAFSKDGNTLLSGGGTADARGEVRFWQTAGPGWIVPDAHKKVISCAAWSPDGKTLATGSNDNTIILWDALTGKPKATLEGHEGPVRSLAFRPDGKMLASSSEDKTVKLWDVATNQERAELTRHPRFVVGVAFSPDGKLLATCSAAEADGDKVGAIKVFDVQTGKERTGADWTDKPARSVAFSPDGKSLAAGSFGPNNLKIYDVGTGKLRQTVTGPTRLARSPFRPTASWWLPDTASALSAAPAASRYGTRRPGKCGRRCLGTPAFVRAWPSRPTARCWPAPARTARSRCSI